MSQMQNWCVCQMCGRTLERDEAISDGWLVDTYRLKPDLDIVRCYRHISEWALRMTTTGRTNARRQMMRDGKARELADPDGPIHPYNEPFPLTDGEP